MASVYILYSQTLDRFYIGSCNDLNYRIEQHFNKEFAKSFTAKADDWVLYFSKDNLGYEQARHIERHIKKMKSRAYLKNLTVYPEIFEKLMQKYI